MTEKIRDSFIFYRSFYQSAKKLPKEDKAELFDAICSYALDGELIDLSVVPEAIFTVIQPNLDANRRRWENGCKDKKKAEPKQEISKTEAKDKQTVSRAEGNKDKDVNVDKDVKSKLELESQFESFWNLYNKKTGRTDVEKKFKLALKKNSIDDIMSGLQSYVSTRSEDSQYWKNPSTWLNQECWKDEYSNSSTTGESKFAAYQHLKK